MATKDGRPDDLIPHFLSDHAEEPEQPGIGKAWDRAVISSRILKTSILFVTAAPVFFAVLLVENPTALFANATASLAGTLAPLDGTGQSMPTIQSTAGAQALAPTGDASTGDKIDTPSRSALRLRLGFAAFPPTTAASADFSLRLDTVAPAFKTAVQSQTEDGQPPAEALLKQFQAWAADEETRDEITGAFEPADQSQSEIRQPPAEALLKQFQAWAAEEDARVKVPPVQDAQVQVQDAQAQEVQNARAQVRPVQKHRHVKSVQIARADIRPVKNTRAKVVKNARAQVRRERNVQAQVPPEQNALPQDRSVQNAETQWPERRFVWLD